jgi:hypothetical protein
MSPQTALRRVLFGNLMLIAALGGMLVQQRWAHQDSNTTIVADGGDRQVTLRDSLMSLPGFVTCGLRNHPQGREPGAPPRPHTHRLG